MPATDAATLLSLPSTACFNNYGSQSNLLKLALLQIIANALNPMAATDPQSLLSTVQCYNCNYSWPLLELALLQIIANGITGGGGSSPAQIGFVYTGAYANPNQQTGRPGSTLVPSNPNAAAIFYQIPADGTGSNVWTWDSSLQTWNQYSV
jgi:hypothetical protein